MRRRPALVLVALLLLASCANDGRGLGSANDNNKSIVKETTPSTDEGTDLFSDETLPDEDAQTEAYRAVVEAMHGDPVCIRVLDWGGEKEIEALAAQGYVSEIADANPALGARGIRMLLRNPDLLETQFAAILRAGAAGPVRALLPPFTFTDQEAFVGDVPALGQHTDQILGELGFTNAEVAAMKADKIIHEGEPK